MISNVALAVGIIILAAFVSLYSPALGGIVAMLPTKALGYALILSGQDDPHALREGVKGMLLGTVCITLPLLVFLYWFTK